MSRPMYEIGSSTKRAPSSCAILLDVSRTRSKYGPDLRFVQSTCSLPLYSLIRPSGTSRPIASRGSTPAEREPYCRTSWRVPRSSGVGTFSDPVPQEASLDEAPQRSRNTEHLQHPCDILGEPGILKIEAPLAADPDGARDHGPVTRVDNPRSTLAPAL